MPSNIQFHWYYDERKGEGDPTWELRLSDEVKGVINRDLKEKFNILEDFNPMVHVTIQGLDRLVITRNDVGHLGRHYRKDLHRAKLLAVQRQGALGG